MPCMRKLMKMEFVCRDSDKGNQSRDMIGIKHECRFATAREKENGQ